MGSAHAHQAKESPWRGESGLDHQFPLLLGAFLLIGECHRDKDRLVFCGLACLKSIDISQDTLHVLPPS